MIGAPSDENECRQMLYTAYRYQGPAAIRYPRGTGPGAIIANEMTGMEIGKAVEVRRGARRDIMLRRLARRGVDCRRKTGRDPARHAMGEAAG